MTVRVEETALPEFDPRACAALGPIFDSEGNNRQEQFSTSMDKAILRRFIGLCVYYSEAIPNLQLELGPLHQIQ